MNEHLTAPEGYHRKYSLYNIPNPTRPSSSARDTDDSPNKRVPRLKALLIMRNVKIHNVQAAYYP